MVLDQLASGLVFSSIIVLGSIGLSLVYSIANFANFAHGDTMTIGAYASLVTFGASASMMFFPSPPILASTSRETPETILVGLPLGTSVELDWRSSMVCETVYSS